MHATASLSQKAFSTCCLPSPRQCVEWLRKPATPVFKKIAAIFLSLSAFFAIAKFSQPVALLAGIGAFFLWQQGVAEADLRMKSFAKMINALGGQRKYLSYPETDLSITSLDPQLHASILRKTTADGQSAIILGLKERTLGEPFFLELSLSDNHHSWTIQAAEQKHLKSLQFYTLSVPEEVRTILEERHHHLQLKD